ncbi:hypothetical protein F3J27_14820 [Enterobacter sp. Ap-916]|uniref:hypothetical protein n=1 Tax=unclassified Enterobacter TaxID=2608935 RepID=UPI00141E283B|nr:MULTISPECIES: hypothetical protein [unclassified Enterobacter]NIF59522.1 hypothetical protein [Enterobacter sp. Ap-867]NIG30752.1 hypothetical protein [Enterobacter sp. Ap-916]
MAKLQDCQFIEVKIDGKTIAGSSEEKKYSKWMEGYAPAGLNTFSGPDGTYFDSVQMSILVTKETSKIFENYLKRGHKDVTITIVHRGSDKFDADYEIQRAIYSTCTIQSLSFEMRDQLFINLTFSFEGMVEVVFNVANATESGLDKIGPIKYSIPEKVLK